MNYQVLAGVPTTAISFDVSLLGLLAGGVLLVCVGALLFHASADWRASVTPTWLTRDSRSPRLRLVSQD